MIKRPLYLTIALFAAFSTLKLSAQTTDSLYYDLGRVRIRKDATQAITIKGADLEKMPFSDFTDAVNAWLYGIYGSKVTYIPVVDGIQMNDVSAYSIYDIEEITLIQNSATLVNGISPQQFMLVVKTRRNKPGKHGLTTAGQTNRVSLNQPLGTTGNSTSSYYHQYYLGAYTNSNKINAGVSATYQHDAIPVNLGQNGASFADPATISRFKFNGYLDAALGSHSVLSVNAGYLPQVDKAMSNFSIITPSLSSQNIQEKDNTHHFFSNVSLKSTFAGLHNVLSGGYQRYEDNVNQNLYYANTGGNYNINSIAKSKGDNFLARDILSYQLKSGDWSFEPAVSIEHRYYKRADTTTQTITTNIGGNQQNITSQSTSLSAKSTILTPTVSIGYHDIIWVQAGFESILTHFGPGYNGFTPQKTYPFVSTMINLSKNQGLAVSVYGSYAKTITYISDVHLSLNDIGDNGGLQFTNYGGSFFTANLNDNIYKTYNQWQAGTTIKLGGAVTFDYTFTNRKYLTPLNVQYITPGGVVSAYSFTDSKLNAHRFSVGVKVLNKADANWTTNLNATYLKENNDVSTITGAYLPVGASGDHLVTGGFVNRLNISNILLGADLLYVFHEANASLPTVQHINVFDLQNAYVGYRFKAGLLKNMDVFANARSIVQNRAYNYIDNRKFYGLGFKADL